MFNGSYLVMWSFLFSLVDINRKDFYSIIVWWIVIKMYFSDVNYNFFMNSGG